MSNESKLNWNVWLFIGVVVILTSCNEFTKGKNENKETKQNLADTNEPDKNILQNKKFTFSDPSIDVFGWIIFDNSIMNNCKFVSNMWSDAPITVNGSFKLKNDLITFEWNNPQYQGPTQAKLIKNTSSAWKIETETAIYEEE